MSQWTALLFLVVLVARFHDMRRPWVFVSLLALLTVTMLLYTVTAVFIGLLLVLLPALLAWRGNRRATATPTTQWRPRRSIADRLLRYYVQLSAHY